MKKLFTFVMAFAATAAMAATVIQCETNPIIVDGKAPANLEITNGYYTGGQGDYADFKGSDGEIFYAVSLEADTYTFKVYCCNGKDRYLNIYQKGGSDLTIESQGYKRLQHLSLGEDWNKAFASQKVEAGALAAGEYLLGLEGTEWVVFDRIEISGSQSSVITPTECNTKVLKCATEEGVANYVTTAASPANLEIGYDFYGPGYYADFKNSNGEIFFPITLPAASYTMTVYGCNSDKRYLNIYRKGTGAETITIEGETYAKQNFYPVGSDWEKTFVAAEAEVGSLESGDYVLGLYGEGWVAYDRIEILADKDVFCTTTVVEAAVETIKTCKRIVNGVLVIEYEGALYNAQGVQL